ncbi:MAG: HAL/PAL/TAL family ammonia-lyase [Syntrophobacteraceae bacterium]
MENKEDIQGIVLSGQGLTTKQVAAVAKHGALVSITGDPQVLELVRESSAFVQRAVKTGEKIYGINTGFGAMANITIPEAELIALQNNLIRFMKTGAGDYLPEEEVRAAMILRANSHLRGYSGIRLELIERIMTFLNNGVTPRVRELGSIGASGDLAPLASIAGALIGAAPSFEVDFQGHKTDCLTALEKLGLAPLTLQPKEGLAMVNGTSVMTGTAALCLHDTRTLLALGLGFHALAFQALKASNQAFHPLIHQLKPHPGQILSADLMLRLLNGSKMSRNELDGRHAPRGTQPLQDRYSLRCLPQYLGPVLDGFHAAVSAVEIEMNSVNDNPIIDGQNRVSYHTGNFLGQYVGVWMDHMRYYLGLMAKHIDTQIALLVAPEFNGGLPPSLVGNSARTVNMGLKGLQICGNSIMPLLSFYGNSIADRYPTHAEQFNQNINSQGLNSAVLTRKSVRLMNSYLAVALLFGVQAVELRAFADTGSYDPRKVLSPLSVPLYEAIRAELALPPDPARPLIRNDDEQALDLYIQTISTNIASEGSIPRAITEAISI